MNIKEKNNLTKSNRYINLDNILSKNFIKITKKKLKKKKYKDFLIYNLVVLEIDEIRPTVVTII